MVEDGYGLKYEIRKRLVEEDYDFKIKIVEPEIGREILRSNR